MYGRSRDEVPHYINTALVEECRIEGRLVGRKEGRTDGRRTTLELTVLPFFQAHVVMAIVHRSVREVKFGRPSGTYLVNKSPDQLVENRVVFALQLQSLSGPL